MLWVCFFLLLAAVPTGGLVPRDATQHGARHKRQILQDQPRLLTENGDLVFQCGSTKSIHLRPSTGGAVFVGTDNLTHIANLARGNNDEIQRLKSVTEAPSNLDGRVSSLETTVRTLTNVPTQLSTLTTNFNNLKTNWDNANAATRLTSVESRVTAVTSTANTLQTTQTSMTSRLTTLENTVRTANANVRLTTVESRVNSVTSTTTSLQTSQSSLTSRVATLESSVQTNSYATRLQSAETRLNTVVNSASTLQNGQDAMDRRLTSLEGRVTTLTTTVGDEDTSGLKQRVQALETTVQSLQQLLTTNECQSSPCQNGGTCVDKYNGFFCKCPDQWNGPTCAVDVNECSEFAGTDRGCQNGATCTNLQGSFSCHCTANWFGVLCTSADNSCNGATNQALCGHGTCVNQPNTLPNTPNYRCICDSGWTKDPGSDPACNTDIDECSLPSQPCSTSPVVRCINTPGSFTCGLCPAGYTGNGFTCSDVNECETNNGGCSQAPRVDCVNTLGSRTCGPCPGGYQGNGITCTYVGLCSTSNGGCHPLATCTQNSGIIGVTCTCPSGYVGSGVGAQGCAASGSTTGACAANPCRQGTCQVTGSSYRCFCSPGYTGGNCDTDINECNATPCQNGGTCSNTVGSFSCFCSSDWTGPTCTEEQQGCGSFLSGDSGSFSYPRTQGSNYSHSANCAWQITTDQDKILSITFPRFSIEAHPTCNFDFLQIHDGANPSAHLVGRYCGSTAPGTINSTHNQLYFWFKSDASVTSDGFTVAWTSADPVCGGILSNSSFGAISSPGYPGNYPHNRDCVWVVSVAPGNNIQISFAAMQLENHTTCAYDYLEIRNGQEAESPLLQKYCSTSLPAPITTSGPYAYLRFHSDASLNDRGFHVTYTTVSAGQGCGGALSGDDGTVQSPNYPAPYDHDGECVWTITVDGTDNVLLSFDAFNLESGSGCPFDYLEIRDGLDETAPSLGRLCGTSIPSSVTSSGNSLFLKFKTDTSVTGTGFLARWTAGCGGVFTGSQGTLTSPSFPNTYPHNKQCDYTINLPEGKRVRLAFNNFTIEGGSCSYDYLQINDGSTDQATQLGRYCGDNLPPPQTSTGSNMFLRFVTDGSVSRMGFSATYISENAECGGILRDSTGTITSPGHPNVYPHGANCTWYIQVPAGLIVQLSFSAFSLESSSTCRYDYVQIYDSDTALNTTSLGRYCGSAAPPQLTSTNNYLTVVFGADASIASEGFSASYTTLNATTSCGRSLLSETGVVQSPGYPDNYPHNRNCTWIIIVPANRQIRLNITNFNVEAHPNCRYDYLEIRNGGFASSPLIGQRICGRLSNDQLQAYSITSNSNRLWLNFVSDSSSSGTGFNIFYDGTATGCGGNLSTPTGEFLSPNYPSPYAHNAECFWTIRVSQGSAVRLVFQDMDIETHSSCVYDYVEIRENDAQGRQIGDRLCGQRNVTTGGVITSSVNQIWVKFRTDVSVSGRGFRASYTTECNNRLSALSGNIESINYPEPYPVSSNCSWVIAATRGNTLNVSLLFLDLEGHATCAYDYLQLLDGENAGAASLGKFCGSSLPVPNPIITSSSNTMRINFISDSSLNGGGFRLYYNTNGCGGALRGASGSFSSPNFPQPYDHGRTCEWSISVNTSFSVQLTFHTFDLETSNNCTYDYVQVFGGSDDTGSNLAKLCPTTTHTQVITASGNTMFIRMSTDISAAGQGFNATWTQVAGGCGGNFSALSANIMSKNYPSNYPHNTECEWLITLPENHPVVFTFQDFDLEGGSCNYDYVDLYDGPSSQAPRLLRACGSGLPDNTTYRSSSNVMFVKMRTDSSVSARGFKASYAAGCGGVVDASTDGAITSRNYPNTYPANTNCTWLITSPSNTDRVTLTFTHMDVELTGSCTDDYVLVLNGNDASSPLLGRYCGDTVPPQMTSSGNSLFVIFVTDNYNQRSGFRADYSNSQSGCGGTYTAVNGDFVSPSYPNSYPLDVECVWIIAAASFGRKQLSFSRFSLESSRNCTNDYVEVRTGGATGPLVSRSCGANAPATALAGNAALWVKFRSDSRVTGAGFMASWSTVYGGSFNSDSGNITSPNYPQNYPNNADVAYTITVTSGMQIRLEFGQLNMEGPGPYSCPYDYVRIRDGGLSSSPALGTFCGSGNTVIPAIITTSNEVRVEFITDSSVTRTGFRLAWRATNEQPAPATTPSGGSTSSPVSGCGGSLVVGGAVTTITSPGYPNGYSAGLNCVWSVSAPVGNRIWVNITDIDLESHGSCSYDYVSVYDADVTTGTPAGQFCGRVGNSAPLESSSNVLTVVFRSDSSINMTGFTLQLRTVCGGTLPRASTGVILSPGYPQAYPANSNCTWVVNVNFGRTVNVTFTSTFALQASTGCASDYVQLLNGRSATSPPLLPNGTVASASATGRYCGSTPPVGLETSSNYLTVNFVSDSSGSAAGFSLLYSEVVVTCGGQLTLTRGVSSGYLTSPGYPGNYPQSVDCVWVITAPAGERVQLDFVEDFDIERHSSCRYDYLQARDGGTLTSPVLDTLCGNSLPGSIYSTANVIYLRFRTDNSVAKKGFKVNYKIAGCGGRLSGQNGTLQSPNYPSNYDSNSNCSWYVVGPVGHYLTFTFSAFALQPSSSCGSNDYIEVREYNETGPVVLQASCGSSKPASFDTSDNVAFVKFVSDGSTQSTGFSLGYVASQEACGGDLSGSTGTISSPNWPGQYPHSRTCTWRITVQTGRRVKLTFQDFGLESTTLCNWDYVQVTNGIIAGSPAFRRLCGTTIPDPVSSSANTMTVKFRSDGSNSVRGFTATYTSLEEAVCGGQLSTPTNLTSPGYFENGNYSNTEHCVWRISNPQRSNSSIRINVRDLALEVHSSCLWDYLEFREGPDATGPLIEKFCGNNTVPAPIVTPVGELWVRFRTDSSRVARGFNVDLDSTRCGGVLTGSSGVITSPNYPADYDHNDNCAWLIQAPQGMRIRLRFTDFSLENHTNCVYDYLEVLNGGLPDSPSAGKHCGLNPIASFVSQSNGLRLLFKSDVSLSARGFRAVYNFDSEACGGLFHGNDGSLSTPNYPGSYPSNTECVWDVNVPEGYTLQLTFASDFSLQGGTGCNSDYAEVRDVLTNGTQRLLGRYCSSAMPPVLASSSTRLLVKFHSDFSGSSTGFSANWTTNCGGLFTEKSGLIRSPGYPTAYDNRLRCNYTIVGDPDHYIILSFASTSTNPYELEGRPENNCRYDYIQVFGGLNASAPQLGRFCGTTAPQPVDSLGAMHLRFWTDSSIVKKGFLAAYRVEACGGVYTEDSGQLYTPTYPNDYAANSNCSWIITVNTTNIVALKFTSFLIEPHSSCAYDYVAVYDGPSASSPLIGKYCGTVAPDVIRSTGNSMFINFVTDSSVSDDGFQGGYWSTFGPQHGCGGVLNQTRGVLASFDSDRDGRYENGLDCAWTIFAASDKSIALNFTSLSVENGGPNCNFDYVAVYDGLSTSAPLIGKYCSNGGPLPYIVTSTNVAFVLFHTDYSVTTGGFNISYAQRDAVCGGTLTSTQTPQNVTSPSYPSPYSQSIRCRWSIDSGSGSRQVSLTLLDLSLTESDSCGDEYIEFRDQPMGVSGRSVKFCGSDPPQTFDSIGQVVQVNYNLVGGSTSRGFKLSYAWADCNKRLTASSGRITSPGYPGVYPTNANCDVIVTSPAGTTLAFYFTQFYVEPHSNCRYDYLQIRNGTNSTAPAVAQLCGATLPDSVFLSSNAALLHFQTDSSVQHPGYDISFTSTSQGVGCGGNLTGISGSLTSPNFPGNFSDVTTCTWNIRVPASRRVTLSFSYLAVLGDSDCDNNYLQVYNGPTIGSPTFGRYCDALPANLTATSNTATVKLTSTGSSAAPSFRIVYTS